MQIGMLTLAMAMVFAIGTASAAAAQKSTASQAPDANGAGSTATDGIPSRCNTYSMSERIEHQLPHIVNQGGSASTVSDVEFLTDAKRVTYAAASGQEPDLHMLQCPVRITWDNGHQDFGYYTEWEDPNQQVRVSFAPRPMQPPTMKQ
jgi:hypothetical protein